MLSQSALLPCRPCIRPVVRSDSQQPSLLRSTWTASSPSGTGSRDVVALAGAVVACRTAAKGSGGVRRKHARLVVSKSDGGTDGVELPLSSCVKIWASGASPSYMLPWQVTAQQEWTGSAFAVLVSGHWRLLTNAHVVNGALRLQVSQQSKSKKVETKVLALAHDLDLALLDVPDEAFQESVPPVEFADGLPSLFLDVETIGYPTGGTTVCVTKGVVSRVDAQLYAHPAQLGIVSWGYNCPGKLLIVQIDAAINPGNSGGPAIDRRGKVLGVASSGMNDAQNVGYIIPSCLVQNFLAEVVATGTWGGIADPGFRFRNLESEPLRQYLNVAEGATGVQLTSVAPTGALASHVNTGDVLLTIDGQDISNEGTVLKKLPSGQDVQLPFEYLITSKPRGEETSLSVMRSGGDEEDLKVVFQPIPALLPRYHGVDATPSYFICGGFVFTRLSTPLLLELHIPTAMHSRLRAWREDKEEVVILMKKLSHSVNEGVDASLARILQDVNGQPVSTLSDLVKETMSLIAGEQEDFIRFGFLQHCQGDGGNAEVEVLSRELVLEADKYILEQHQIPAPVSTDLADVYRAHAPSDVACVSEWLHTLEVKTRSADADDGAEEDESETDESEDESAEPAAEDAETRE